MGKMQRSVIIIVTLHHDIVVSGQQEIDCIISAYLQYTKHKVEYCEIAKNIPRRPTCRQPWFSFMPLKACNSIQEKNVSNFLLISAHNQTELNLCLSHYKHLIHSLVVRISIQNHCWRANKLPYPKTGENHMHKNDLLSKFAKFSCTTIHKYVYILVIKI